MRLDRRRRRRDKPKTGMSRVRTSADDLPGGGSCLLRQWLVPLEVALVLAGLLSLVSPAGTIRFCVVP